VAASAFDVGFSKRLGPGLVPYLAAVGDVSHGRTPLVDTASRGGWGAIDVLTLLFSAVPLGYGTLALVVSGAAAAAALLVVSLATSVVRPLAAALVLAGASVVVGALAAPVPDAAAPSSGSMTLLLPLAGAVAVVRGAERRGWRVVAPASCALAVLWSAPAAVLTVAAVAAGSGGWPAAARRGHARRCAAACAAGAAVYAIAVVARAGAPPDPRLLLATGPLAPSTGEPAMSAATTLLAALTALMLVLTWWVWRRDARAAPCRTVSAVRALGVLAAALALHGSVAGAPVEIAHAAALALLLAGIVAMPHGNRGVAAVAVAVAAVGACCATTIAARWQTSALYAALPHEPLDALRIEGDAFDQSLRYNVGVLARRTLVAPDDVVAALALMPTATRRGDRVLVALPGTAQAELLALLDSSGMLPLGDPTTGAVVGPLRARLSAAISALPSRARIVTRRDWLADPGGVHALELDERGPLRALTILLRSFEARVVLRRSALVVAELRRRPA
jgi:hypothetical protein